MKLGLNIFISHIFDCPTSKPYLLTINTYAINPSGVFCQLAFQKASGTNEVRRTVQVGDNLEDAVGKTFKELDLQLLNYNLGFCEDVMVDGLPMINVEALCVYRSFVGQDDAGYTGPRWYTDTGVERSDNLNSKETTYYMEALSFIKQSVNGLASVRFKDAKESTAFVNDLYKKGAIRIRVELRKDGGGYEITGGANKLIITLPRDLNARSEVLQTVAEELKHSGHEGFYQEQVKAMEVDNFFDEIRLFWPVNASL